jgi:Protein of unknown function (DUF429)
MVADRRGGARTHRPDPLSVAADRIGHTAMRCAGLLIQLASQERPVDRRGTGVVVKVYPAASLKQWRLPYRGYKLPCNAAELAADLQRHVTGQDLSGSTR